RCDLEIACARDGIILGLRGDVFADVGAYIRTVGTNALRNIGVFLSGPYRIPNIDILAHVELSNKAPCGTYRAPGRFEADFFRDRLLDIAAEDLGIDRVEFRRRNLVSEAEMPYPLAVIAPGHDAPSLDSGAYETVMDLCLEKANWKEKQALQGRE